MAMEHSRRDMLRFIVMGGALMAFPVREAIADGTETGIICIKHGDVIHKHEYPEIFKNLSLASWAEPVSANFMVTRELRDRCPEWLDNAPEIGRRATRRALTAVGVGGEQLADERNAEFDQNKAYDIDRLTVCLDDGFERQTTPWAYAHNKHIEQLSDGSWAVFEYQDFVYTKNVDGIKAGYQFSALCLCDDQSALLRAA